jgi:phage major head subunit gpT-like protein
VAVINTGLLTKGLRSEFFNRFEAAPAHYRELATRVPSNTHTEIYRWLGSVPRMREWGTGRLARGLRSEIGNSRYGPHSRSAKRRGRAHAKRSR